MAVAYGSQRETVTMEPAIVVATAGLYTPRGFSV
jgi:hypothetical protein